MFIVAIYGANKKYAFVIKIAQVDIFKKREGKTKNDTKQKRFDEENGGSRRMEAGAKSG